MENQLFPEHQQPIFHQLDWRCISLRYVENRINWYQLKHGKLAKHMVDFLNKLSQPSWSIAIGTCHLSCCAIKFSLKCKKFPERRCNLPQSRLLTALREVLQFNKKLQTSYKHDWNLCHMRDGSQDNSPDWSLNLIYEFMRWTFTSLKNPYSCYWINRQCSVQRSTAHVNTVFPFASETFLTQNTWFSAANLLM